MDKGKPCECKNENDLCRFCFRREEARQERIEDWVIRNLTPNDKYKIYPMEATE